eukprot:CAMPEP_0172064982 /NCGR_PEP_ID=MMETSP1043-20130122/10399_1 /TAXON_ID=464988 /ORGANISM="Hemiselmis andersenii, Strain CCMP441" /LENGTH=111 /DNA_ID=CAMNT_0012725073 /DNA_START=189 /DNA_END=522 /DNA_ORIENTATION=-
MGLWVDVQRVVVQALEGDVAPLDPVAPCEGDVARLVGGVAGGEEAMSSEEGMAAFVLWCFWRLSFIASPFCAWPRGETSCSSWDRAAASPSIMVCVAMPGCPTCAVSSIVW